MRFAEWLHLRSLVDESPDYELGAWKKGTVAHLPSEGIKDDNFALIRSRVYPRPTR
jgi:hypothetical protein